MPTRARWGPSRIVTAGLAVVLFVLADVAAGIDEPVHEVMLHSRRLAVVLVCSVVGLALVAWLLERQHGRTTALLARRHHAAPHHHRRRLPALSPMSALFPWADRPPGGDPPPGRSGGRR
ncbi:hypothetical protein, partial [Streptomyces sp. NRRL S-495]|uniref:hypothetical protein n=1 Tax=Streptomyces sp. NRRL S-495 TaxID=1609133 RepID=UPI00133191CE